MRRKISSVKGRSALATVLESTVLESTLLESTVLEQTESSKEGKPRKEAETRKEVVPPKEAVATAVRYLLEELATLHPGRTLEVRVPPYGAVQCVAGPTHTRGTPPNVVECSPEVWIALATGALSWEEALNDHQVIASGTRASLAGLLPLC
ncbi:MAG TPA: sterol carrier family protein [Microbacteriaceae bacterium]|nr:sterol carrier family protein [Microbacteriaceae bacterium]